MVSERAQKDTGYTSGYKKDGDDYGTIMIDASAIDVAIKDGVVKLYCETEIADQIVSAFVNLFGLKDWEYKPSKPDVAHNMC